MYKFIKANSKKLLAIFAAVLMIAFILPTTFTGYQGNMNPVFGTIGDKDIRASEFVRAGNEWKLLSRLGDKSLGGLPIVFELATRDELEAVRFSLQSGRELPVPLAIREIEANLDMYALLQFEAREMGISISKDEVETVLANRVNLGRDLTPERLAEIRQAITNFLPVLRARDRATGVVKVSDPLRKYAIARGLQMISLNVVELRASEFSEKVAAPTPQQLNEQYEKYKDVDPLSPDAMNGVGFGYRLPDRVKIQHIEIPINAVRDAVKQRKSDYDWEVEAYKTYTRNQQEYQTTTQPAESPADALTLGPSTAPAAAVPTTRPFEEVRSQIVDRVVAEEAKKLSLTIQNQIAAMLADDWRKNRPSQASTPATNPVTATDFQSHEYLQGLAAKIEEQFKVRPNVTTIAEFQSALDLQDLPGIGMATSDRMPLWAIVLTKAKAFAEDAQNPSLLDLFEPSPPLLDFAGNVYFFRLTEAEASRPATFEEVAAKVENDWRALQTMDLAKSAAQALLDSARDVGLESAANAAGRPLIVTGKFSNRATASIENYTSLPTSATPAFMEQAFNLLSEAAKSGKADPVAMINLPQAQRVVVAELKSVEPVWDESSFAFFDFRAGQDLARMYEASVLRDWFSFENVKTRLNFTQTDIESLPAPAAPGGAPPISERPLI